MNERKGWRGFKWKWIEVKFFGILIFFFHILDMFTKRLEEGEDHPTATKWAKTMPTATLKPP